jgi:ribonuclease HII
MIAYEDQLWQKGVLKIAGVDEVGRGCLFGDVVAAAVILPANQVFNGINDSKKLSAKKREYWYDRIMEEAMAVAVSRVDATKIDEINIRQAARLAMKQAVADLQVAPQHLLVDAESIDLDYPQTAIIHGDAISQSIAAASIIAKVTRDRLCEDWHAQYPNYGLNQHKGYATALHRRQIMEHGATPLHRKTFLRKLLAE